VPRGPNRIANIGSILPRVVSILWPEQTHDIFCEKITDVNLFGISQLTSSAAGNAPISEKTAEEELKVGCLHQQFHYSIRGTC